MNRAPHRLSADDVTSFLQRARAFTKRGKEQLEKLTDLRVAAATRLSTGLVTAEPDAADRLFNEILARDEELTSTSDELREQIATLAKACALLERERSKYVDLFTHAPDPYVVTDFLGTTQEANLAAGALLSVDPGFMRGRPLIGFVARNDTHEFRRLLQELAAESAVGPARSVTLRMRPRGQPTFVCHARVSVVLAPSRRCVALRWTLRRADADEALAGLHIGEGELARSIVEDFRGPVTIVAGWARLLREGGIDDEEGRAHAFDWLEQSAASQQAMLDDLAELIELQGEGQPLPATETVDLLDRVRAAIEGLRAFLDPASPTLDSEVDGNAVHVSLPSAAFDRALDLLLRRALAGTPRSGGVLSVRVSRAAGEAIVSVEVPLGTAVPHGWGVRMATAARWVRMCRGRLALDEEAPSARIILPAHTRR